MKSNDDMMMNCNGYTLTLSLLFLSVSVRAQVSEDDHKRILQDSVSSDYEEWLRNEPLYRNPHDDSITVTPLPPSFGIEHPQELQPKHPPISINIITPRVKNDMRLAYQGHWLEEQRKAQQGGAMTIGANPLTFIAYLFHKLFPKHKSKKERERERFQQILDNY